MRTKAGLFNIDKSLYLEELDSIENIQKNLINPIEYLNYPKIELNNIQKEKISHGNPIEIQAQNGIHILTQNNKILAVSNIQDRQAKALKVFI